METFGANVDGFYDVEDQLPRFLRRRAERQFEAAERERARVDSVAAHEERREHIRSHFFEALGGLPREEVPLNPTTADTIERDGYTVENVVFESLRDFHVTSNLYLPDAEGPVPGVLFFCGHADVGKAADLYQQACIDLVRNGLGVLAVDPLGQGERHQFYDPETGECPRRNTSEHTHLGHQCTLAGTNVARYFVRDCVRSLDYLAGRPEVDPDRIGATGNSGGGLQTAYLMLADDRLDAAVPCCFITSKEDYMKTGQGQDGEQILHRAIERGPRYDDFLSAFAPKPVRIGAAQSDFLCVEGAHRSYERAGDVYELYDAADRIDLTVADETHGLSPPLRQATVNWFREHLLGEPPTFRTGDPETVGPETLQCTEDGEVAAEYPDERTVVDLTREYVREHVPETDGPAPLEDESAHEEGDYPAALRRRVRDRFDLERDGAELFPRRYAETREDGLVREKVFFRSEPDIVTTGAVIRRPGVDPTDPVEEPTVVLLERGTEDLPAYEDAVATLARERGFVLVFDPRGVGAVQSRDVNTPRMNGGEYYGTHGTEYKLASDALKLGTSLVALRVFDVIRAADYLTERFADTGGDTAVDADPDTVSDPDPDLGVVGVGTGAIHALYAAVADRRFRSIQVEDVPTFHERATSEEITVKPGLDVHGVVGDLDVPQLLPALADRDVERVPVADGELPRR